MMRKLVLALWVFWIFHSLAAQQPVHSVAEIAEKDSLDTKLPSISILDNIEVNQDPRLEKMLEWHVENNKKKDYL